MSRVIVVCIINKERNVKECSVLADRVSGEKRQFILDVRISHNIHGETRGKNAVLISGLFTSQWSSGSPPCTVGASFLYCSWELCNYLMENLRAALQVTDDPPRIPSEMDIASLDQSDYLTDPQKP